MTWQGARGVTADRRGRVSDSGLPPQGTSLPGDFERMEGLGMEGQVLPFASRILRRLLWAKGKT